MRGRGSIPRELQEAVSILEGQIPSDAPWPISAADQYMSRKARREELILKELEKAVPFSASETISRYSEAIQQVEAEARMRERSLLPEPASMEPRKTPELFMATTGEPDRRTDKRRYKEAHRLLHEWMREWMRCGQSTALLMHHRPDIEDAFARWWTQPKKFRWSVIPTGNAPEVLSRPSAKGIACRAFWAVLCHPLRTRFAICRSCDRIYFAISGRKTRLYCGRPQCGSRNSEKPYMAKLEQEKLEVTRGLLELNKDPDWRKWLLKQREAKNAGITGHWITRRIREGKLTLPAELKGEK